MCWRTEFGSHAAGDEGRGLTAGPAAGQVAASYLESRPKHDGAIKKPLVYGAASVSPCRLSSSRLLQMVACTAESQRFMAPLLLNCQRVTHDADGRRAAEPRQGPALPDRRRVTDATGHISGLEGQATSTLDHQFRARPKLPKKLTSCVHGRYYAVVLL